MLTTIRKGQTVLAPSQRRKQKHVCGRDPLKVMQLTHSSESTAGTSAYNILCVRICSLTLD